MFNVFLLILAYLIGSIQPAFLISKLLKGTDIREHGSNNSGASNMTMTFGWGYGILTALLDILKGYFPVFILKNTSDVSLTFVALFGALIIVGHIFPFYMQFKGGKGTASMTGFIFAISPFAGLVSLVGIFSVTVLTGYIFLGTLFLYSLAIVVLYIEGVEVGVIIITCLLFVLSLFKHRVNIKRIMNGEETSLHSLLKKRT